MKVYVCTHCGSANIQQNALVHYNNREDIQTFDYLYCENCESSCNAREVEVTRAFNIYTDLYKEST